MKKINLKNLVLVVGLSIISVTVINKCSFHSLPKEKLKSVNVSIKEMYVDDEFQIIIKNRIDCPNRYVLSSQDSEVDKILDTISPLLVGANTDTTLVIKGRGDLKGKIKSELRWGNPELPVNTKIIDQLPYPNGKSYNLMQGNDSNPTHNTTASRYAFDFTMKIGDTITSTQNGYVVLAVDGYTGWGYGDQWKPFANQIMIYDTTSHLFTDYGHLMQHGSLVELGDYVIIGQPIALSGMTGQTQEEHLHFNVFCASTGKKSLESYPLDSIGSYNVKQLKRHQVMTAKK